MSAFSSLVRTDIALYFANRRAVLINLAAPILIAAFVGFIFGPSSGKTSRIPVAVTDLDASPLSQRVVAELRTDEALAVAEMADAQWQAERHHRHTQRLWATCTERIVWRWRKT